MKVTRIPQTQAQVLQLAFLALAGAQAHGLAIALKQNNAAAIAGDLYAHTGDPATPAIPGQQAILSAHLASIQQLRLAANVALKNGRAYCLTGFGVLRPI